MTDFKSQLRRQLRFLENSCRLYDQGNADEAIRLAVSMRILFHDTNRSVSLLNHLGSKSIFLLSTARLCKKAQEVNLALVHTAGLLHFPDLSFSARPLLANSERREDVLFQTWWRKEPIIELNNRETVCNRRDLILAAADKDGGAHVDKDLEPTYEKTRDGAGVKLEFVFKHGLPNRTAPLENVHLASLRQIAYEILNSEAIQKLAK